MVFRRPYGRTQVYIIIYRLDVFRDCEYKSCKFHTEKEKRHNRSKGENRDHKVTAGNLMYLSVLLNGELVENVTCD